MNILTRETSVINTLELKIDTEEERVGNSERCADPFFAPFHTNHRLLLQTAASISCVLHLALT